jgi:hypothetical protein
MVCRIRTRSRLVATLLGSVSQLDFSAVFGMAPAVVMILAMPELGTLQPRLTADIGRGFPLLGVVASVPDPRLLRLRAFFRERQAPAYALSEDFLVAADRHNLDWRLLPSLSVVESGGAKLFSRNNIFGWGAREFRSVREGIHYVAGRLANSTYYHGKDLDSLLWTYNPIPGYPDRVKTLMRQIGPRR